MKDKLAREAIERIFKQLERLPDTYGLSSHFKCSDGNINNHTKYPINIAVKFDSIDKLLRELFEYLNIEEVYIPGKTILKKKVKK